jgi:teichuronic acid biosynthesis glycosyltransferase TuaG
MDRLVSIIMPAYNAERYIDEAIRSVLAQTHTAWELLLVNDGSTDATAAIIDSYTDTRIRIFHKSNGGIGSARNLALAHATGDFMCGLDADDVFPPESLAERLAVFTEHPETDIVDGRVIFMDGTLTKVQRTFIPTFLGEPFHELLSLSGSCFMGFSWLIRWSPGLSLRFDEGLTHGEDLLFYLLYAPHRSYRYTESTVLIYRRTGSTAMSNLNGLERSYRYILRQLSLQGIATERELEHFRRRTRRIMVVSYLRALKPLDALRCLFNPG